MDGGTGGHKEPVTLDMIGQPPSEDLYITASFTHELHDNSRPLGLAFLKVN